MSRWDRVWCVTPYAALTPDVAWLSVGLGPKFYAIPQHQGCLEEVASLKDIADLLRHRSVNTATIYVKVDLPRLTAVALPWPGRLT